MAYGMYIYTIPIIIPGEQGAPLFSLRTGRKGLFISFVASLYLIYIVGKGLFTSFIASLFLFYTVRKGLFISYIVSLYSLI